MPNKSTANDLAITILLKYEEFCYKQLTDINSSLILLFWHIGNHINNANSKKNETKSDFWESIAAQLLPGFGKFFVSHELRNMSRFSTIVPDINQAITISNKFSWYTICQILESNQLNKLTEKTNKTSKIREKNTISNQIQLPKKVFLCYCRLLSYKKSFDKKNVSPVNNKLTGAIKKDLLVYRSSQNHIHNFRLNMFAWELGKAIAYINKDKAINLNQTKKQLQGTTLSQNFLQQSALFYSKIRDYDTAIQICNLLPWKYISRIIYPTDSNKILPFAYYLNKNHLSTNDLTIFFKDIKDSPIPESNSKANSLKTVKTDIETKEGRNYTMEIVTKKIKSSIHKKEIEFTFNICESRFFRKTLKTTFNIS